MGGKSLNLSPALDGVVAQLVEHHNGIVGVRGSNPLGSTILRPELDVIHAATPCGPCPPLTRNNTAIRTASPLVT